MWGFGDYSIAFLAPGEKDEAVSASFLIQQGTMDYLYLKLNSRRPWSLTAWILLTLIICTTLDATELEEDADAIAEAPAGPMHPAQELPGTEQSSWGPIEFLGRTIKPGSSSRLFLCPGEGFAPGSLDIPVFVLHGSRPGPQLCAVGGTHGDELNGVEIVRHATDQIRPDQLAGTFIGLPIVNIHGFRRGSRYLPDRRDLNRYFPGNPEGSLASRIAARLFDKVIRYCDVVVDFHTGSFQRKNLVQVRVDFTHLRALELARSFGSGLILHSSGPVGSLRRAAMDAGIIALLYEAGQPARFESEEIAQGIAGLHKLMAALEMLETTTVERKEQLEFRESRWVRADAGGIFLTDQTLGDTIWAGEILGTITDPITNNSTTVWSSESGYILGMAVPQVVLPGFALFHLGIED
jgi:predicted deacylase